MAVLAVALTATLSAAFASGGHHATPTATRQPTSATAAAALSSGSLSRLRQVKHVFDIVLENENYDHSFGAPKLAPYLATSLRHRGLLLKDYYGTGHASNDNYISLVSGQAPNTLTQQDCYTFSDFPVIDQGKTTKGEPHQQLGYGCVYPSNIRQIGDQLTAKHVSWKGYMGDMGNVASREAAACGHPTVGAPDNTEAATAGDGYAARHDPFVYFHSTIDKSAYCRHHVVALGSSSGKLPATAYKGETGLATDLKHTSTTPAYSFITPNLCDDGHDYPCRTGQKSRGSKQADIDHWLKVWVPKILHSPAYKKNGLIEITFDESDGANSDSTACCDEQPDPNASSGKAGMTGPGGGKIGALLISRYLTADSTSAHHYNHYSTLATNEAIFGLGKLGYASTATVFSPTRFHRRH
jgi:hypothetical protein